MAGEHTEKAVVVVYLWNSCYGQMIAPGGRNARAVSLKTSSGPRPATKAHEIDFIHGKTYKMFVSIIGVQLQPNIERQ